MAFNFKNLKNKKLEIRNKRPPDYNSSILKIKRDI